MAQAFLEHANITVTDAHASAAMLERLFGWRIRWEGEAKNGGYSIHVGDDASYLALYTPQGGLQKSPDTYSHQGAMNHIGVVVDDLDRVEKLVKAEGLKPHLHGDYEPGSRFYFDDPDGIEIEVVSYG